MKGPARRAVGLRLGRRLPTIAVGLLLAFPRLAHADTTHTVQRGHTIEAIAHRYHVTVKSIVDANRLADPAHLKPGQTLVIPGVDPKKGQHGKGAAGSHEGTNKERDERHETDPRTNASRAVPVPSPASLAAVAVDPGAGRADGDTVNATRLGEEFHVRVKDAHGHVPPTALRAFERLMREGDATHPVDPRLVSLVGIVSGHFGGRTIDVVSGYRGYRPTQYTPHSNHNVGRALDFRIQGVTPESIRDFCRTLRSAGCGYYPNGSFIHLDVRETKAYWVDPARPGEAPKYDKPGTIADEGADDVPAEAVGSRGSVTDESPGTGSGSTQPPADPVGESQGKPL